MDAKSKGVPSGPKVGPKYTPSGHQVVPKVGQAHTTEYRACMYTAPALEGAKEKRMVTELVGAEEKRTVPTLVGAEKKRMAPVSLM